MITDNGVFTKKKLKVEDNKEIGEKLTDIANFLIENNSYVLRVEFDDVIAMEVTLMQKANIRNKVESEEK